MSYVRVSIQGTSAGGEVWSINPVFDPNGEFEGTVDQAKLDSAALAIANLSPGSINTVVMSTAFTLTGARLEVRADSNDELLGISIQGRTTPLTGGAAPKMPYQAAAVLSLRTNTPGGSGRGRLYWPVLGDTLDTNARISTVTRDGMLANFKTYLAGMQAALGTAFAPITFDLAVRSRLTHTTPHVARLQMGNVVDTQRRRRDKLVESYAATTYP